MCHGDAVHDDDDDDDDVDDALPCVTCEQRWSLPLAHIAPAMMRHISYITSTVRGTTVSNN